MPCYNKGVDLQNEVFAGLFEGSKHPLELQMNGSTTYT